MRARSSGVLFTFALVGILMQHSLSPSSAAASRTAPYGQWESPVSAAMVAEQGLSFGELVTRGEAVYWIERRPEEGGRNAIVRHADGASIDVIPTGFNARNRVHEYGGGDIAPGPDGAVHFVNFADQRLYRVLPGQEPAAISPEGPWRFADCVLDAGRDRLICVGEDHGGGGEPRNLIVAVSMKGGEIVELAGGSDFAASPRIDPTGSRLAWITWDHPDMPWDKTTLWLADIASDGSLRNVRKVADDAAIQQPQWASDGSLHYLSDAGGWWNIHVFDGGQSRPLHGTEADFADPAWVFNRSSYAILDDVIVAVMTKDASDRLVRIDRASGKVEEIETSYVRIGYVRPFGPEGVVFVGAGTTAPAEVVRLDLASGRTDVLADAGKVGVGPEWISAARAITVPVGGDEVTHAFYYPPKNPDFTAPEGTYPPLVVSAHGGPTGHSDPGFSLAIQFWTSRGFAYLDVNYRGSSGYGRAYRDKLKGQWGVIDIEDVVKAALYAADQGLADRERLIVRGGSAGGFVVLAAHAFHDVFATGANYFGVSDLEALARDTHKFESRYLDSLVGPYPERADLYKARSPINHLEGFDRPLIVLQGLEDRIVPPNQSDLIVEALRAKGITVEYLTFPGEGHGFRRPDSRIKSLEAELAFYQRVLGL